MTSKERVFRAIKFENPDKIPLYLFNRDIEKSDIVNIQLGTALDFSPANPMMTEYGYEWERLDDTMGQPKNNVIEDWGQLHSYSMPDPDSPRRYSHLPSMIEKHKHQYIMAGIGTSGFTTVSFIRGFVNMMTDFYEERESLIKLIDMVFDYESRLIENSCAFEIDAFAFYDDWGTQNALFINPVLWREIFLPRYKKQFEILKRHNKHIYFHSCGYVAPIISDLIEAGVDVFNFNQPDVMGIDLLAKYRGQVCFNCPVDLQTVAIHGKPEDIYKYTDELYKKLGTSHGGYIGYVEEYHSIGLSEENYQASIQAVNKINAKYFAR